MEEDTEYATDPDYREHQNLWAQKMKTIQDYILNKQAQLCTGLENGPRKLLT